MPSTALVCGAVSGPSMRAMPKSMTLTVPSRVTMTLPGLMSRWITPCACAAAIAAAIFWAISARLHGGGPAPRRHELGQGASLDVLHDDELRLVVGPRVVDAHDVRLVQARGGLRLAAEPVHEARVARELGQQHLDRDRAAQHRVEAAEHLGHAAGADARLDLVPLAEL